MLEIDYMGLSTDSKPSNARDKETFYEVDTKAIFVYFARTSTWYAM